METVVYSSDSQLRRPAMLLRSMLRDFRASRDLAWRLFLRDLSSRYRQTLFGYLWVLLPTLVTSVGFILLQSSAVIDVSVGDVPYPVFVFAGTVFFSMFTEATSAPLRMVTQSRQMLARVNFPKEALVGAGLLTALFGFAINIGLLAIVLAVYGVMPEPTAFLALVPVIGMALIGTIIGMLLTPIGIIFQDVQFGVGTLTFGVLLVTPVTYLHAEGGFLATIDRANPLSPLVASARDLVFGTGGTTLLTPLVIVGACLGMVLVAWLLMRLAMPIVVERLGA